MKIIIKNLLMKINALNTQSKLYKKYLCIIPMNQNNKISQNKEAMI